VCKHRTQHGAEVTRFLVVDTTAHQIGRQQIRRELDALETTAQGLSQGVDRERFGQPWHPFNQQVPLRQQGHQDALPGSGLAPPPLF